MDADLELALLVLLHRLPQLPVQLLQRLHLQVERAHLRVHLLLLLLLQLGHLLVVIALVPRDVLLALQQTESERRGVMRNERWEEGDAPKSGTNLVELLEALDLLAVLVSRQLEISLRETIG